MSDLWYLFLWLLCYGLGVAGVFRGILRWRQARALRKWPRVQGRIVSSDLAESTSSDPETHTTATNYEACVKYEYQAEGRTWQGSTINTWGLWGIRNTDVTKIAPVVDRYPPGKAVEVTYNPQDPGFALLETDFPFFKNVLVMFLAVVALSAGIFTTAWAVTSELRQPAVVYRATVPVGEITISLEHPGVEHTVSIQPLYAGFGPKIATVQAVMRGPKGNVLFDQPLRFSMRETTEGDFRSGTSTQAQWNTQHLAFIPTDAGPHELLLAPQVREISDVQIVVSDPINPNARPARMRAVAIGGEALATLVLAILIVLLLHRRSRRKSAGTSPAH